MAPLRSSSALVATVVPWTMRSVEASSAARSMPSEPASNSQPVEYPDGLVPWRGGGFRDRDPPAVVDGDEIGERAADVHTDAVSGS